MCSEIADKYGCAFANINIRPYYAEGSKTYGYEIVEQSDNGTADKAHHPIEEGYETKEAYHHHRFRGCFWALGHQADQHKTTHEQPDNEPYGGIEQADYLGQRKNTYPLDLSHDHFLQAIWANGNLTPE